jgi:hypothetical protein
VALPPTPQRTTPGFSFSIVERSLRDCIAERKFGAPEKAFAAEFFGGTCAFCGASPIQRWDHLVAVSQGGDTVLGNMVPACNKCDDSKAHHPFDEWALGDAPGSPRTRGVTDLEAKLARIREYVAMFEYVAREPEERLTPDELKQYALIRSDLQRLRRDVDKFIAMHREAPGSEPAAD